MFGRNKARLTEETKEFCEAERLKILNSRIEQEYLSENAFKYFGGY